MVANSQLTYFNNYELAVGTWQPITNYLQLIVAVIELQDIISNVEHNNEQRKKAWNTNYETPWEVKTIEHVVCVAIESKII